MTDKEFSRLYGLTRSNYERIAFSYVCDKEDARDIVTDCFLYLWEHRDEVKDDNVKGYIYLAVRNRCLSYLRSRQSLQKTKEGLSDLMRLRREMALAALLRSNPLYTDDIIVLFRKALGNMPEMTRKIFSSSREGDLTYRQIALKYNVSVRKVTSEIQLALKILRIALKDYRLLDK